MRAIAIVPADPAAPDSQFVAYSGNLHSAGKTAGAALDSLSAQLSESDRGTLVVVQHYRPDEFFNANQCRRLQELMQRRRSALDAKLDLPAPERQELVALVDAELEAATARAAAMVREKKL